MASNKEKDMTMEALVENTTENTNEGTTAATAETTTTIAVAEAVEATEEIKEIPGTAVTTANRGKGLGYFEEPADLSGINNFEKLLKQASDSRTQEAAEWFMHKLAPQLTAKKGTERFLDEGYISLELSFVQECLESVLKINRLSTKGEIAQTLNEFATYLMQVQHLTMIPSMQEIFLNKAVEEITAAGVNEEEAEKAKNEMLEKAKDGNHSAEAIMPYNKERPENEVWIVPAKGVGDTIPQGKGKNHIANILMFRDMVKEEEAKEAAGATEPTAEVPKEQAAPEKKSKKCKPTEAAEPVAKAANNDDGNQNG